MIGPNERFVIETVGMLEAGVTPFPGGWASMPAGLVEAVQIVQAELADIRKRFLDRAGNGAN